jgi:hypothetical protein
MSRDRERVEKRIEELENKLSSARDSLTRVHEFLRFKSTPITRAEAAVIEQLGYAIDDAKPKSYSTTSPYTSSSFYTAHEYQPCEVCDESTHFENIWESDEGLVCKECYAEQQEEESEAE